MSQKYKNHAVVSVFVFLLMGLFAVFGTLLVMLGSQAYRQIARQTAVHNETRVIQSFVRHAVRAEDSAGAVSIDKSSGSTVLKVANAEYDLVTYVYAYEGTLRELYLFSDEGFQPDRGEIICKISDFDAQIDGQTLTVYLTDEAGRRNEVVIALFSGEVAS